MPANITATFRGGAIVRLSPGRRRLRLDLDLGGRSGPQSEGVRKIRAALERLGTQDIRVEEEAPEQAPMSLPDVQYISSSLPKGYDTLLGFISRENPEMLDHMADPISDVEEDHAVIRGMMAGTGKEVLEVPACPALQFLGVMSDSAYPKEYLGRLYL